jgi:hypothetical protein
MLDENYGNVTCPYCEGRFQELKDYEVVDEWGYTSNFTDVDGDKLNETMVNHWEKCTAEDPYYDDPNNKK